MHTLIIKEFNDGHLSIVWAADRSFGIVQKLILLLHNLQRKRQLRLRLLLRLHFLTQLSQNLISHQQVFTGHFAN